MTVEKVPLPSAICGGSFVVICALPPICTHLRYPAPRYKRQSIQLLHPNIFLTSNNLHVLNSRLLTDVDVKRADELGSLPTPSRLSRLSRPRRYVRADQLRINWRDSQLGAAAPIVCRHTVPLPPSWTIRRPNYSSLYDCFTAQIKRSASLLDLGLTIDIAAAQFTRGCIICSYWEKDELRSLP